MTGELKAQRSTTTERMAARMYEDSLFESGRFYEDDGSELNLDLVPTPPRCLTCRKHDMGGEEYFLCTLNRADQADKDEFECGSYEPLT
jgi:hypothetical protein